MNVKQIVRLFVPPILVALVNKIRYWGQRAEWEYAVQGWQTAENDPAIKGWDQASILEANQSRWSAFLDSISGTNPFGISPEATESSPEDHLPFHNMMMSFAYALSLTAATTRHISMLDWGGGIGHYYALAQRLRPDLTVDYSCKDFEQFANFGQSLFPESHFYANDEWKNHSYDLVCASGSLHYSQNWQDDFKALASVTKGYFYLARLPMVRDVPSYVMIQRPYQYGYDTEYLGWCLNRNDVLKCADECELTLVREFVIEMPPVIKNAPEQPSYWGFLFRK